MSNMSNRKKLCVSSLVLGIVSIVFSLFLPFISYSCAIPGLVIAIKKKKNNYNTTPGIILNIISLSLSVINSVLGIIMTVKLFFDKNQNEE